MELIKMFSWKKKATNAIYLKEDNGGKGRPFESRFLEAGLVKYSFGVCLLTKETIDKFVSGFVGCPVIIDHQDITDENVKEKSVGVISDVWYNEKDGWFWCKGIITDKEAIDLINKGYTASCQYEITEYQENTENKLHNGNEFDKYILNGKPEHLAIVENPRYENDYIAVNAIEVRAENADKWITIKPNGEENKGKHLLLKDGATPQAAIERTYRKKNKKSNISDETDPTVISLEEWMSKPREIDLEERPIKLQEYLEEKAPLLFPDEWIVGHPLKITKQDKKKQTEKIEQNFAARTKAAKEYAELEKQQKLPTVKEKIKYRADGLDPESTVAAIRMFWKKANIKKQKEKQQAQNNIKEQEMFNLGKNKEANVEEIKTMLEALTADVAALKARNEAEDEEKAKKADNEDDKEDDDKKATNEDVDKRKLIDEIGGILKGKVDDELWRTIIGKAEKIAYDKSEAGTADNKCKNKCKNEDDEAEYDDLKKDVEEEAKNKKAKNSIEELFYTGQYKKKTLYTTQKQAIELGKEIF